MDVSPNYNLSQRMFPELIYPLANAKQQWIITLLHHYSLFIIHYSLFFILYSLFFILYSFNQGINVFNVFCSFQF
jgi:hypothetical protein